MKNIKKKYICDCGGKYTYQHKARHCESQKHITFIENNKLNFILI